LIGSLEKSIIKPAREKANELRQHRAQGPGFRNTFDYLTAQNFEITKLLNRCGVISFDATRQLDN